MTPPPGSGNIEQIQMAPGAPSAAAAGDTAMRENAGDTTPERAREVTLWDLYRLAMADDGTQDIENTREEISEDESDAESDNSGSGSDLDAVEFESCKLLGIKPESFHEPRGVPTFRPTAEQFADFAAFIKAVEPWGRRRGLVKVIPPPEWFEALGDPVNYVPELASQFPIKTPINQHFQGNSGQYRQLNVEDRRAKWSFAQFAEAALSEERRPACLARKKRRDRDNPGSDSDDEGATTSRRRGFRGSAGQKRSRKNKSEGDEKQETNVGKSSAAAVQTEEVESGAVTETESSKITQPDASHLPTPPRDLDEAKQISDAAAPLARKTRTAEKARTTDASSLESLPTELIAAFAKMDKLLPPEIIPDLEREYWRTLTYAAPMYGADQLGSLFPKDFKHGWNLRNLDNLLSRAKLTLPGVTDPYVYAGMWKSTFAWHLEDMDLYSINYVHMGAPKHWYVIPPPKAKQFERIARSTFPSDYKQCREFMRHKQFLLSPKFLAHHGIQSLRAVQRQGEFIITYPYSYHAGFNCGLNLAEAVNFATKSWIKIGKKAGYCTCIPDSVRIDMDALLGKPKPVQDIYCDESEEEEFDSRIGPIVPHFMGSRQAAPIPRSVPAMKRGGGRVGPSAGTTRPMLNAAPALGGHVSNAWTAGMMRPTQPGLWPRPYTPFPYPYPNPYLYPPHNRLQPFQMPRAVAPVPLLPVPILPARPVNSEPAAAVTKPQVAVNAAK